MTLRPAPRSSPLPLSFAQQRLWVLNQIDPRSPAYNLPLGFRLSGVLDRQAVADTLTEIARRHEVLRTTFGINQGEPTLHIAPPRPVSFEERDLRSEYAARGDEAMIQLASQTLQQPFDLSTGPLWRTLLVRVHNSVDYLLVIVHHIVSDGWSLAIFRREFEHLYAKHRGSDLPALPELPLQYVDFAFSQRRWFQGPELQRQLAYWTQRLRGAPTSLALPFDRERPPVGTHEGATRSFTLSKELTDALKSYGQAQGVTPFMMLLSAFNILLHRYTQEEDILVGIPDGNRHLLDLEPLQGIFVNTLVMRTDLSGNPTFQDLIARVRQQVLEAYEHRDLPFESLVEALQPQRSLSHAPLFQVMFVMQNTPLEEFARTAPAFAQSVTLSGPARYDLTVYALETGGGLRLSLEYNTDLFDQATIARMEGHWRTLVQDVVSHPDRTIGSLELLTEAERERLLHEWNQTSRDYPRGSSLHGLFEQQASRTPDAVAAIDFNHRWTYRDLNRAANHLAHRLRSRGIGRGDRVGVLLPRGVELLASLLGILKTGAAYVPLDGTYPRERLEFMATDAQVRCLLTVESLGWNLETSPVPVLTLDFATFHGLGSAWDNSSGPGVDPNSPAYVIYTSGSTGRPKGAVIPHRGVVNYLSWCVEAYELNHGNGAPVHSSIAFDLTITALFAPLLRGKPTLLLPEEDTLEVLAKALRPSEPFGLVKITPAHLELLARLIPPAEAAKAARFFVIGGENLRSEVLAFWRKHAPETALINEYGPTETVVGCCVYQVPPGELRPGVVPIGRPIANTQLYVLDARQQPVPVGVAGELYIGGEGVGLGYLNRPELTAERFLPNPFAPGSSSRLYRTGDRVRYLADGNLECLGRIDQQIKLRGHRVELGEIEAVLKEHDSVAEAAVVVREDTPGDQRLVAYLVPSAAASPDLESLRKHARRLLPAHMCPVAWRIISKIPLTPNGKLDRGALPPPESVASSAREVALPRTAAEQRILEIWRELLRVEQVGIHENFFDLGGHSILLIQLHARIQEAFQREFPLIEMFRHPTVARLAELVEGKDAGAEGMAEAEERAQRQRRFLTQRREGGEI